MENNQCSGNSPTNSCGATAATTRICSDAARRVETELKKSPKKAVIACEGSCINGEVARLAANSLAYDRQREATVRICLGDASTGNSGMVELVKRAPEVIAIEGCPLHCGTAILQTRLPDLQTTIIDAAKLYSFDHAKFSNVLDFSREQLDEYAKNVVDYAERNCF